MTQDMKQELLLKKICNRYVRLFPIVVMAVSFAFATMVFGLQYHTNISDLVMNKDFLSEYGNFKPTIGNLIGDSLIGTFFDKSIYVGPFWTIKYEFFGYVLCMLVCYILKQSKLRRIGYIIVAAYMFWFISSNYTSFLMGVFVADLIYKSEEGTTVLSKYYEFIYAKTTRYIMIITGLYFITCPKQFSGIHVILDYIPLMKPSIINAVGWAFIIFGLYNSEKITRLFEGRTLKFFGKISFPLYAFHWPIMLTLQAYLFEKILANASYNVAAVGAFLITLPVIVLLAWLIFKIEKMEEWNVNRLLDRMKVD